MPYNPTKPFFEEMVRVFTPVGGTPTGTRVNAPMPFRGRVMEVGFVPNSLVASAMTMAVAIGDNSSNIASNFTQIVTSTLGTFSSTLLVEGACCSAIPPSASYANQGDAIQWTLSGGNTSAIGVTVYAICRKGGVG